MKSRQFVFWALVTSVFIIFAFFRFYNLVLRIPFDWDQEQFSTQIYNLVVNHNLTLLGPRVISDKGFFLAPYFTYLLTPLYLLTNMHPWALLHFIILINCIFFITSFIIIHKIWNKYIALVFLFLWTFNSQLVKYEVVPWWPIMIPLGVIGVWYLLQRIYQKNLLKDYLLLGLTIGFFMNMHFQFIFLLFFSLTFLYLHLKKAKTFILKNVLALFFSLLLPFTPLLLFDLKHEFLNSKLLMGFIQNGGVDSSAKDIFAWIPVLENFFQPFTYVRSFFLLLIFIACVFLILYYLIKSGNGFFHLFYQSALVLFILTGVVFAFYGKRPSEYYFLFLVPFISIILADFFIQNKKILFLFIPFFFLININFNISETRGGLYGLYYKDKLTSMLKQMTKGKKYYVSFNTIPGGNTGYPYLFKIYGLNPTDTADSPLFEILIPPTDREGEVRVGGTGILIPPAYRKELAP